MTMEKTEEQVNQSSTNATGDQKQINISPEEEEKKISND